LAEAEKYLGLTMEELAIYVDLESLKGFGLQKTLEKSTK